MIYNSSHRNAGGIFLVTALIFFTGCENERVTDRAGIPNAFEQNKRLGRGGNIGNILYQWNNWDKKRELEEYDLMKEAGLSGVRINVRPFLHMQTEPPYTISDSLYERLDWTVNEALKRGFTVIIDNHQYRVMGADPIGLRDKFYSSWEQMGQHYKDLPDNVYFGVLNEPNGNLTPYLWNYLLADVYKIIRKSNPARTLVIGPGSWNGFNALEELKLPEDDRNIIVEVHYYSPHRFTHQGTDGYETPVIWMGSPEEMQAIEDDFAKAMAWGRKHNRPLFLGEFGVYKKADQESAVRWLAFVREQIEKGSMSWSMWDLMRSGMGIYDEVKKEWIPERKNAVLPPGPVNR